MQFALLSAINTALLIWILISKGPSEMDAFNRNLEDKLKQYEPNYDWFGNNLDTADIRIATETWDKLQTAGCCGWANPEDWDNLRPTNLTSELYPKSCCPNKIQSNLNEFCSKENGLYTKGCLDLVLSSQMIELRVYMIFVGAQVVLCLLSCIVAFLNVDKQNVRTESQSHIYRTNPNPIAMYPR